MLHIYYKIEPNVALLKLIRLPDNVFPISKIDNLERALIVLNERNVFSLCRDFLKTNQKLSHIFFALSK